MAPTLAPPSSRRAEGFDKNTFAVPLKGTPTPASRAIWCGQLKFGALQRTGASFYSHDGRKPRCLGPPNRGIKNRWTARPYGDRHALRSHFANRGVDCSYREN